MPFTSPEDQAAVEANGGFPITVGDRCREHYKKMVAAWVACPRWKTAHKLYLDLMWDSFNRAPSDDIAAHQLAWQIFLLKFVWPYEQEAIKRNGDIQ